MPEVTANPTISLGLNFGAPNVYYLSDGTAIFGIVSNPEGVITAYPGSMAIGIRGSAVEGKWYRKNSGVSNTDWVDMTSGGGGSGTVTSFSAGDLSPLFTTTEATPTTTPALTFAQIAQTQNLIFASPSGSTGVPTFRALTTLDIPNLTSNIANAIAYDNGGGFFISTDGLLLDPLTLSVILGKVGIANGQMILRGKVSGQTTLTVPDTVQTQTIKLPSLNNPSVGNVMAVSAVSAGVITLDWSAPNTGTVTNFSAGDLSPLFTTSEATTNTTPALTFAQIAQTQNLIFASPNGSTGVPTFRALLNADLPTSGVTPAAYTNANITVNAQGVITAAANGSSAGTTINPTDNVLPVRTSATVFGDSKISLSTNSTVITASDAAALAIGANGNTNPVLRVVTNVASQATGLDITGNAAGSAVTINVLSSGANENLKFVPKGTGAVVVPDGLVGTPSLVFATALTTGFFNASSGQVSIVTSGTERMRASGFGIDLGASSQLVWGSAFNTADLRLRRVAAANIALGNTDAAAPVAQSFSVQNVVAGTSNTAGVDYTRKASAGTGTGAGGKHIWQVAAAGSAGTAQNALAQRMALDSTGALQLAQNGVAVLGLLHVEPTINSTKPLYINAPSGLSVDLCQFQNNLSDRFVVSSTGKITNSKGGVQAVRSIGQISTDVTDHNNASTAATDLATYAMPASTLNTNTDVLRATFSLITAGNVNGKTIDVVFGSSNIGTSGSLALNGANIQIDVVIARVSSSVQRCCVVFTTNSGLLTTTTKYTDTTEDLTTILTLKSVGTGGATNDITNKLAIYEVIPA